jgi:hypothetical protein
MRPVRFKERNITVFVGSDGDPFPIGEICFREDEFAWANRLSTDFSDPGAKSAFWTTVLEKKKARPSYSLFEDFPRTADPGGRSAELARKYAGPIIDRLRGRQPIEEESA